MIAPEEIARVDVLYGPFSAEHRRSRKPGVEFFGERNNALIHGLSRMSAGTGFATGIAIALGTGEGLAIALGQSAEIFSYATIAGFLGLTVWLIATGIGLIRGK
jgi:hypothetical protein